MNSYRRSLIAAAGATALGPFMRSWGADKVPATRSDRLVLSNFVNGYMHPGAGWRGFSDRVMGGISNARLKAANIEGKNSIRLTGNVTRESNGGFIQMALYFSEQDNQLDGSGYKGIEMLVYGNSENYNLHVRTADCGWHDQSYRATFFAEPRWQRVRFAWDELTGNNIDVRLDSSRLQRIAILGWMREFEADVALAEISLYS